MARARDAGRAGVVAVDLGGTQLRVAVFEAGGELRSRDARPSPGDRPDALAEAIREAAARASFPLAGAVVGVPGPVSHLEGRPLRLPNLPQWEGHVSAQALADATGLPTVVANDANLAALGEHRFGAGIGTQDMAYVTSSTGVGAGIILNGRLLYGRRSLPELGWTVIDLESAATVEELGSGTALAREAGMGGAEVTRRAQAGDATAAAAFARVAHALATGVLNLVFSFMPERVVIGGGVSQAGELLLGPVRELIEREGPRLAIVPEVVRATGGDDVGLLGGLALWQDITAPEAASARPRMTPAQPSRA